ncbi:methyltransferase [Spiroplasma clarkii]|uniref:hypothetical protein n=1 Tax=Spiroplasma clarkii TaxID=2139 RepID=UPI000B5508D5|nr:hypothetical protein [Spiroplasma clarkii]ARU90897.1 methyltransferase [Spiroplasma clarkii]
MNEEPNLNSNPKLSTARHELTITLDQLVYAAKVGLKNGGRFLLIHLAERLDEIIFVLKKHNFAVKRIEVIYSKADQDAKKF